MKETEKNKSRSFILTGLEYLFSFLMFSILVFVVVATYIAIR